MENYSYTVTRYPEFSTGTFIRLSGVSSDIGQTWVIVGFCRSYEGVPCYEMVALTSPQEHQNKVGYLRTETCEYTDEQFEEVDATF